jgi:hypothetical protein
VRDCDDFVVFRAGYAAGAEAGGVVREVAGEGVGVGGEGEVGGAAEKMSDFGWWYGGCVIPFAGEADG